MKSKFFKGIAVNSIILASALTFANCGDSSSPAAPSDPQSVNSSASVDSTVVPTVDPVVDPTIDPENNSTTTPDNPTVDPVTDPNPASSMSIDSGSDPTPISSSAVETPASSANVQPEISSSSEKVEPASSSVEVPKGIFLANDTDENKNYMEVEYIKNTGDNGGGVLAYPKNLSTTQKHGVVLWGPGGGSNPNDYEGIIRRLASHGFVVIATSESPDNTTRGVPALDWLEKKNNTPGDPLYQKMDFTKVGASGHSMGGLQSERMLVDDKRVITAALNNSGSLSGGTLQYAPAGKTAVIVYGEVGSENTNAEKDYANNVKIPACLIRMENHNFGHGSGPWDGMAVTVAWMRWQLGGEDFRKADFVGTSGKYINGAVPVGGNYNGQCKNF